MLQLDSPEIRFALESVRQATRLARQIQAELVLPALLKQDRSPVTIADYAVQALIARLLAESFPSDALVAEENAQALREPAAEQTLEQVTRFFSQHFGPSTPEQVCAWIDRGRTDVIASREANPANVIARYEAIPADNYHPARFWVLDPIDGTKGFLRRDQYAVALALVEENKVQIGVLGCPNLVDGMTPSMDGAGSIIVAARGQGAWTIEVGYTNPADKNHPSEMKARRYPTSLRVSDRSNPAFARLLRSVESGHTNVSQIDMFAQAMGIQAEPVMMDSQAKYSVLAAGGGDLILRLLSASQPDYREKIWDQAAGAIVLEEAGGQISDLDGKELDFSAGRTLLHNRGILASNGILHASALEALRMIGVSGTNPV